MKVPQSGIYFLVLLLQCALGSCVSGQALHHASLASLSLDADRISRIDSVVASGIRNGNMPGCVVLIGYQGRIASLKAYGHRCIAPSAVPMTTDTVFDLASLTKPIATAASVMTLVDRGLIDSVDDRVVKYLPKFMGHGKEQITIAHLLTHQSGLLPDNSMRDYAEGFEHAINQINALPLRAAVGEKFMYSDVGFIVLGELVRTVSGKDLDAYSQSAIFQRLEMHNTRFLPNATMKDLAAPTEKRDGVWMKGQVHDPRAFALEGVAGHAGLFSTAEDLAIFARMMIEGGSLGDTRILSKSTFDEWTRPRTVSSGLRAFGWDVQSTYSSNRGDLLSKTAFGHGGFTGTAIWIDPEQQLFVIFLSNRLHPDGKGAVNSIAGRVATLAASAIRKK